jgi:hypothetical protein
MVPGGRDRAGGAEVEAARAADDLRARMRAELGAELDVARLVEGADRSAAASSARATAAGSRGSARK